MEKNTHKLDSKNKKLLIVTAIVAILISITCAFGLWLYKADYSIICTVKYVHWHNEIEIQKYHKGEKINFPETPVKIGYNFVGWALDNNENKILTQEILIEHELTLYAQWEEQTYTLEYDNLETTLTHKCIFTIEDNLLKILGNGEVLEIEQPSQEGKEFVGWQITDGVEFFDINNFSFAKANSRNLKLIPIFDDIKFKFNIKGNRNEFIINNCSHNSVISQLETLSFVIILDKNVNQSNITISTTSGVLNYSYNNGEYFVNISNFEEDFSILIYNISTNKYLITFDNEGEISSHEYEHGKTIQFPQLVRAGYKLVGFKDTEGRLYTANYIITSNLYLYAIWEQETYNITLPKSNGSYYITIDNEVMSNNQSISKTYGESLSLEITLANAYNKSNFSIYALSPNGKISPIKNSEKVYTFDNIQSDMQIVIKNIILNTYSVNVDGANYGKFSYGSWIIIEDDIIIIKDAYSNQTIQINTIITDDNFRGWLCNNSTLTNCIVQDIANIEGNINIFGNYSKKVTRLQFVTNGGVLDIDEIIITEEEELLLPQPIKLGYNFAGWYTKLVEVNTVVDQNLSIKFDGITDFCMILYAGWTK